MFDRFALLARRRTLTFACAMTLAATSLQAQSQKRSDNYDELYQHYLDEARQAPSASPQTQAWGWMNGFGQDFRARAKNDLVTIHVTESITGSGSADAATAKNSSANIAIRTHTFDAKSKTDFKGSGTTTRAGELTAQLTARVADVLPNGDLVVEGVREIEINGDRQIVVLSGVIRPVDVGQNNVVSSTAIGQLRIRYFGRGLIKDNLQPGWLIRILNKVF